MTLFVIGLVVFFGVHSIAIFGVRESLIRAFGAKPYRALYALISLIGLVLLIKGYGHARYATEWLYVPHVGLKHLSLLLMLPVFPLLLSTYLAGRIRATVKHPTLTAVKTWAMAHLLANGTVADVMLFGGFLTWAVVDRISLKRRKAQNPPPSGWTTGDAVALVAGLAFYGAFVVWGHRWLIGVSVLPGR